MARKVDYEIKTDKKGREYANRIDLKTGKKKRVNVKVAKKRLRDIRYRENKREKEKELKKVGSNWKEYQKEKKEVKKREKKEGKKRKKTKKQQEQEEKRIEKEALKRVGVRSRYRFWWKYWEMPNCGTPTFISDAQAFDGNHYEKMKEYCEGIHQDVMASDLCPDIPVEGGACIVLYKRKDREVIKYHEIGEGCHKV